MRPQSLWPHRPGILTSPCPVRAGLLQERNTAETFHFSARDPPTPTPATSIKSHCCLEGREREFFQRMPVCIVGSSKRFGELQVTAQPDKWQEVRDLGLTFFAQRPYGPAR